MKQTQYRDPKTAPLTKLTIDLINTYKHINEVRLKLLQFRGEGQFKFSGEDL